MGEILCPKVASSQSVHILGARSCSFTCKLQTRYYEVMPKEL